MTESINKLKKSLLQAEEERNQMENQYKELLKISGTEVSRIFNVEIKQLDHLIDISKFFISLSSAAIFAIFGLPTVIDRQPLLALSLIILGVAIIFLYILMRKRGKHVSWYTKTYPNKRLQHHKFLFNRNISKF